jgi:two-component system sensor histidine kinase AlgZ
MGRSTSQKPLIRADDRSSEFSVLMLRSVHNSCMSKANTTYWICQAAGWGAYSAIGLTTAVMEHGWRPSIVIGYILFFAYSIGLTHLMRATIRREGWMTMPLARLLPRVAVACMAIGIIQSMLVVAIYRAIEGRLDFWSEPSSIIYMFLGVTVVCGMWSTLYIGLTSMRRSREARRAEVQMQLALSNAELRALEAQLNPHFLFNCLNSIRGMISEDPAQARNMVTRLASILRYSLQRDRQRLAPLAGEMEVVSDYLALEAIRFDDRLRVRVEIDEAARASSVPPMLLQTLVENAIKHGIEEAPGGGDVLIRAWVADGKLRVEVENPGTLAASEEDSTRIGLKNARERLRILYGERASLQLVAPSHGRVSATLQIPAAI